MWSGRGGVSFIVVGTGWSVVEESSKGMLSVCLVEEMMFVSCVYERLRVEVCNGREFWIVRECRTIVG